MLYIFDYDGTLRSVSIEGIYEAYRAIIREFIKKNPEDFFADIDEFKKWYGPVADSIRRIGANPETDMREIDKIFRREYSKFTEIFPWVGVVLKIISKKNLLAVCSTASSSLIKKELGKTADLFFMIIGWDSVKKVKPDPEGIYHILKRSNQLPENAIIIGDTESDILAGKSAGVKTAAVTWGLCEKEKLIRCSPDYILSSPKELIPFPLEEH